LSAPVTTVCNPSGDTRWNSVTESTVNTHSFFKNVMPYGYSLEFLRWIREWHSPPSRVSVHPWLKELKAWVDGVSTIFHCKCDADFDYLLRICWRENVSGRVCIDRRTKFIIKANTSRSTGSRCRVGLGLVESQNLRARLCPPRLNGLAAALHYEEHGRKMLNHTRGRR
jgi:hypothetical protein